MHVSTKLHDKELIISYTLIIVLYIQWKIN